MDSNLLSPKHRKFYVNDRLEFALFYDALITDKDKILKDFLDSSLWKCHESYCKLKIVSTKISEDLKEVWITTKPC